jgi:HNH endonuclease
MLHIEDITVIKKKNNGKGYEVIFADNRIIWLSKARTIIALLILIKYGEGSEADLAKGTSKIPEIKKVLEGKYPPDLIKDYYGDANKPFSELWNEEGFVWIRNPSGQRTIRSQKYVLLPEDHEKLFLPVRKAFRTSPSANNLINIKQRLPVTQCNLCGSHVFAESEISAVAFAKDRLRRRLDHRVPVEKGGNSEIDNFQVLCFYCNKSKWQVCNVCTLNDCTGCVLAFPENSNIVAPTQEDISDRIKKI